MTREEAHKLIDMLFSASEQEELHEEEIVVEEVSARITPENKRVVRTKNTGDRVYQLDEVKKVRQWVSTGEVLEKLGWIQADVVTIEDTELLGYQLGPVIYRVDDEPTA